MKMKTKIQLPYIFFWSMILKIQIENLERRGLILIIWNMIQEHSHIWQYWMNEKEQIIKTYLKWSPYQIQLKNYKFW